MAMEHNQSCPRTFVGLTWAMAFVALWIATGLFVDGWAHTHGRVDNTFFTPYHAFLYSGMVGAFTVLSIAAYIHRRPGVPLWRAVPKQYRLAWFGVALFALGGIADLGWHKLFGFEVSTEALLSPSHLVLALAGWLIVSSPWRYVRAAEASLASFSKVLVPFLVSGASMLAMFTFFTQFAHPVPDFFWYGGPRPTSSAASMQEMGIVSMIFTTCSFAGFLFIMMMRRKLPIGSYTFVLATNAAAMSFLSDQSVPILPVAVWSAVAFGLAGLAIDLLSQRISLKTPSRSVYLLSFATPALIAGSFFGVLALVHGIWWSVHLWAGTIVMSGIGGMFVYAVARRSDV